MRIKLYRRQLLATLTPWHKQPTVELVVIIRRRRQSELDTDETLHAPVELKALIRRNPKPIELPPGYEHTHPLSGITGDLR